MSLAPGFASVVLDVDSTLCGIEGIDWLAMRLGAGVGASVAALTDQAMRGEIPLGAVYGARLALVRPGDVELRALADAYLAALAPGAAEAIALMQRDSVRVVLVSGGLREAILPVARHVGIADDDVHAVSVRLGTEGQYLGYDADSPLVQSAGKPEVVAALLLTPRVLAVGDGATDLAIRHVADGFAAFTGVVTRPSVVAGADVVIDSFAQLVELVRQ